MLSERLGSLAGQLSPASGALVSCAALFEQLLPSAGGAAAAAILAEQTDGTSAAIALYEQALATAPIEVSEFCSRPCHLIIGRVGDEVTCLMPPIGACAAWRTWNSKQSAMLPPIISADRFWHHHRLSGGAAASFSL